MTRLSAHVARAMSPATSNLPVGLQPLVLLACRPRADDLVCAVQHRELRRLSTDLCHHIGERPSGLGLRRILIARGSMSATPRSSTASMPQTSTFFSRGTRSRASESCGNRSARGRSRSASSKRSNHMSSAGCCLVCFRRQKRVQPLPHRCLLPEHHPPIAGRARAITQLEGGVPRLKSRFRNPGVASSRVG
jgi:hypothetical protein